MNDSKTVFLASSTTLSKINTEDLKVGMYVSKLDKPWLESDFLYQGFELKNQADIDAVCQQCRFVFIDLDKQNNSLSFKSTAVPYSKEALAGNPEHVPRSSFAKEIDRAANIYKASGNLVKSLMEDISLDRSISVKMAKKAVADCVNSVLNTPDALLWMTQLKNKHLYTSQHSMNVCILAINLGRQIKLTVDQLNVLGLCGMMHDMGKMRIPLEILDKPGKLEADELKIMQNHTALGWKLLQSSNEMSNEAIEVAHNHHERLDGSGYPRQLKAENISLYTRIVTIADIYDAITSDRVYQKGRTHVDAISIMTKLCETDIDADLTYKFIECLGIYPPGSIIELSNGEIAIVVEANQKKKLKPKIILLLDEQKKPRVERMVDLSKIDVDATGKPYQILKTVRADAFGIDLNKYYHNGAMAKEMASM